MSSFLELPNREIHDLWPTVCHCIWFVHHVFKERGKVYSSIFSK